MGPKTFVIILFSLEYLKSAMSKEFYLEQAIFSKNNADGNSFFLKAKIQLPYVGRNGYGRHDDLVQVAFYESFSNENVNVNLYDEDLLKTVLLPQVSADRLPSALTEPDFYRDLYEFRQGDITQSIYIWDASIADLEIDLSPVYFLQKMIFVMDRTHDMVINFHELHCLVTPIPL